MRVGFTGPRTGMTHAQRVTLANLFVELGAAYLHHGDCIGSDAEADAIAWALGIRRVAHPPADPTLRAFCTSDVIMPEKGYLHRDRDIVNAVQVMIAAPKDGSTGGGTWWTTNYAIAKDVPTIVIKEDGSRCPTDEIPRRGR